MKTDRSRELERVIAENNLLAMRKHLADLEIENQRLQMDLEYEQGERTTAEKLLDDLPEVNLALSQSLHAEQMRNHEYASGEAIQTMAVEIGELKLFAELGRFVIENQTWLVQTFWGLQCARCHAHNPTGTRSHEDWCPIPKLEEIVNEENNEYDD